MAGILNTAWQAVDRFVPDEQVRGVFGRAAPQAQPGQAPPQRQGPTMGQYVQGFIGGHMPAVVRGAYDQVQAQKKQTAADMDEIERLERRGVPSEIAAMLRLDPKSGLEALGKWLEPRTLGEGQTLFSRGEAVGNVPKSYMDGGHPVIIDNMAGRPRSVPPQIEVERADGGDVAERMLRGFRPNGDQVGQPGPGGVTIGQRRPMSYAEEQAQQNQAAAERRFQAEQKLRELLADLEGARAGETARHNRATEAIGRTNANRPRAGSSGDGIVSGGLGGMSTEELLQALGGQ